MVLLKVDLATDINYFMMEDPVAPGFSVEMNDEIYFSSKFRKEYSEKQVFDDRAAFFMANPPRSFYIRYFMRAEIPGKYQVIPAKGGSMYYPELYGTSEDTLLEIEK